MHICRRFLRVQHFLNYVEKEADLFLVSCSLLFLKQLVIIPLRVCFTKYRCKIFCHVGLHLGLQQRIDLIDKNRLLKVLATNFIIDSLCRATRRRLIIIYIKKKL